MPEIEGAFETCLLKLEAGGTIEESLAGQPAWQAELAPLLQVVAALRSLAVPAPARVEQTQKAARAAFLSAAASLKGATSATSEIALDDSLEMAAAGASVDDCLTAFPGHADMLQPALEMISALQASRSAVPPRDAAVLAEQRAAFLSSARQARSRARSGGDRGLAAALANLFRQPVWRAATVLLLLLVTLFGVGGTALTLASDALPGDALYAIKLAGERARVAVTLDETQRAELLQTFEQRRREEVVEVVDQGRQIEVQFPGTIETMVDGVWTIVGLPMAILVPGDAEVIGTPAVGHNVLVIGYSDGQGRFIVRRVFVSGPAGGAPAATATRPPTPTQAPVAAPMPADTATPTSLPTDTPSPTFTPTLTATSTISATATLTPTLTATPTASPSGTPTITPAPSATAGPYPGLHFGLIEEKHPTWWLVSGYRVLLTPSTRIDESLGPADVGAEVAVEGIHQPQIPGIEAALIRVTRGNLESKEWTGEIRSMNGSIWVVGDTAVDVAGAAIVGVGVVGQDATVWATRRANEMWRASNVWVDEYVPIFGTITSISGDIWVVAGQTVNVSDAQFSGVPPRVGLYAEIEAIRRGGQLFAVRVNVLAPAATPTATSFSTATPTATASATDTPTVPPTATPTEPAPTDTPTNEPTATPVDPTATATPTPPFPFPTPTPAQPPPTATFTPVPTPPFTPPPPTLQAPRLPHR